MSTLGLLALAAGVALRRRELARGPVLERAIALGRIFVAAPLATFGGLHLSAAQGLSQMVPGYMPWRLFWTYLVGLGWIATALSLIAGRLVRWSGLLAGLVLLTFVAMLDVPGVAATPHDRFVWTVALRECGFAAGLLALAGSAASTRSWTWLVTAGRIAFAVVAIFFAVENILHPDHVPAVPLERLAPPWEVAPRVWAYSTGAALLASGALLLVNRWARHAAAWLGILVTFEVVVVYCPMIGPAHGTDQMVDAINYVADTLLFAGTALILAEALGAQPSALTRGESSI
ncbi:MAG TPA: hypothetical protein VMD29_03205 [Terracidiphilus sp.]|nr:hypothetical protein [Terracidiphilus sp.]